MGMYRLYSLGLAKAIELLQKFLPMLLFSHAKSLLLIKEN